MLIHEQLSGDFLPMRIGSDCKEEAWLSEVMYKVMETGGDGDRFYVCRNEPETTISDVIEIRSVGRSAAGQYQVSIHDSEISSTNNGGADDRKDRYVVVSVERDCIYSTVRVEGIDK